MKILEKKYCYLIEFYLTNMNESENLKKIDNYIYITLIGMETIMHVFKITMNQTKNIDLSLQYTEQACFLFLEYIEQMNNTNSLHNLNNIDAITFVFKKINEEINTTSNASINALASKNDNKTIHLFNKYSHIITKTILYFFEELNINDVNNRREYNHINGNSGNDLFSNNVSEEWTTIPLENTLAIHQFIHICKTYLFHFISLIDYSITDQPDISYIFKHIHFIQRKLKLNYNHYLVYLHEIHKIIQRMKKNNTIPSEVELYNKYMEVFHNDEFINKIKYYIETNKIQNIVKIFFG